ncbi:hypothetical protein HK405_003248 [Cladochytrium tenue]|nr:hypothetical protein HK405_003248 [Cladochytrium tenue]
MNKRTTRADESVDVDSDVLANQGGPSTGERRIRRPQSAGSSGGRSLEAGDDPMDEDDLAIFRSAEPPIEQSSFRDRVAEFDSNQTRISSLIGRIEEAKQDVAEAKKDVAEAKTRLTTAESKVTAAESEVAAAKVEMAKAKALVAQSEQAAEARATLNTSEASSGAMESLKRSYEEYVDPSSGIQALREALDGPSGSDSQSRRPPVANRHAADFGQRTGHVGDGGAQDDVGFENMADFFDEMTPQEIENYKQRRYWNNVRKMLDPEVWESFQEDLTERVKTGELVVIEEGRFRVSEDPPEAKTLPAETNLSTLTLVEDP